MFIVTIAVSFFMFGLPFLYYALMSKKHRRRRDEARSRTARDDMPESIKNSIDLVIDRRFSYMQNFIIFQVSNKTFGFAGVIYSIIALIYIFKDGIDGMDVVISFFAIVWVVIALYLSPQSRVSQYMNAWRMLDNAISEIIANADYYCELGKICKSANSAQTSKKKICKCVRRITAEANKIVDVLIKAEKTLTTNSE